MTEEKKEEAVEQGVVSSPAIEAVLKELCEECLISEDKVEVSFKSGKDSIRQVFEGPKRFVNALREVLKYI